MRRPLYPAIILVLVASVAAACGSKGPQYPEDHARYVRLDQAMESLRKAYTKRDLSGMEALMLPNEAADRVLHDSKKDFDEFREIALDFSIERVVIDGDRIDVYLHWQGQWKRDPAETGFRDRGHGLLRWTGMQSILLSGVGGDVPFGIAMRRTVPPAHSTGSPPS